MVHCYGGEGLRHSVEAGVRSIDHGVLMTEEDAALMKAHGCWLVPTVTIQRDIKQWAAAGKLSHPHLMPVLFAGHCQIEGIELAYLVTEFAEESLAQVIPERSLTPDEATFNQRIHEIARSGLMQSHLSG